jgi:formate C-acetyltransferase
MTDRIDAIRTRVLSSRQLGDPRAGALHQEALAQSVGEPDVIRHAKAAAHYCRQQDIVFNPGELIVGTRPGLTLDPAGKVTQQIFGRRTFAPPAAAWWPVPEETHPFWAEGVLSPAGNHTTLDYESIFAAGFEGLLRRVDQRQASLTAADPEAPAKRDFLTALRLVGQGHLDLSQRYADAALAQAGTTADPARKAELETIARNCRQVPALPPTTFWEACQCAWFSFFFLPDAPGRVDQYLAPCYRRDMESGALTREFAKELLSCLWLKYFESVGAASGVSAHNHLTLGGVTPDGRDASNEVTVLCLEVTEELRIQRPQVGLRWHRGTPPELLRRAVRVLRSGTANPDFCSDEQIVPALTGIGVSLEDARDFSLSGCHEVIVTGRAQMGSVEGFINLPKVLRMTLGLEPALQADARLHDLTSPGALWEALCESLDRVAEMAHRSALGRDRLAAEQPGGHLQASLVVRDCIEACRGYTQGGARYNFCNWDVIGLANLADALAVLHRIVFAERSLTLHGFVDILARDWEGAETLRRRVLTDVSHFGNDDSDVDDLAGRILEALSARLRRRTPYRGGSYILGTTAGGENMHVEYGRITGATPDGRKAGATLADSLGAAQGRDRHGITALLNSVARLPHRLLPTATTLNVKLDPHIIASEDGVAKVAALIEAHFRAGGQQMQFNLVNREMLLEARQHPEAYPELMVRVAGYCAPFTSLWGDLQDEIIARTEHSAAAT